MNPHSARYLYSPVPDFCVAKVIGQFRELIVYSVHPVVESGIFQGANLL